jgi:hypothetical protein
MMGQIIQFVPTKDLEASQNLQKFIELCRYKLTIFGAELDWDADAWDVTQTVNKPGRKGRIALVWTNHDTSTQKLGSPINQPFLDFAKAFMRYQHSLRPTKVVGFRMSALRALERALEEQDDVPGVEKADPAVFNRAAGLIREKFSTAAAYRIGSQLEMIANFISENYLVPVRFSWKNPLGRPHDKNRVGKKADKERTDRLPSQASLDALAKAFFMASEPADVLIASTAALLCCAPDRINEVLRLPVDCEVSMKRSDGEEAYGLRWWPSKGAEPMVKWIVGTMADVAKEAIDKIRKQTEEARNMAKWYEENPTRLYLPNELENLRGQNCLNMKEVGGVLGLGDRTSVNSWLINHGVSVEKRNNLHSCLYRDFESAVLSVIPKGFPSIDSEISLKYSEALFVVPNNFFHQRRRASRCLFEKVDTETINYGLGSAVQHGKSSIFSRLGFAEPDGSPIKITTHQFRHWLNTLAQKGGLSQLDIAKWSGRKDMRQNEAYDHVTAEEILVKVRELDDGSILGPLAEFVSKAPVSREEFLQLKFPTVHTTEFGFCIHDWTMLSCQRHRDCVTCTEQLCIKGDQKKTERIKQFLHDVEEQVKKAESAVSEGFAGADRWLEHHKMVMERLLGLVAILEDPAVPIGTIIQLSNEYEFSPIEIAIDERRRLEGNDSILLTQTNLIENSGTHGNSLKAKEN